MKRRSLLWLFCIFIAAHPSCRCCPEGSCRWAWETCPSCNFGLFGSFLEGPEPDPDPRPDASSAFAVHEAGADGMPIVRRAPTGGGLALVTTQAGMFAIASTEDDRVRVVRVDPREDGDMPLWRGDNPGRVIADPSRGVAYVALTDGGAIATIDPTAMTFTRWNTCASPRGLAFDRTRDVLYVACASGEIVTLSTANGVETNRTFVARDLEEVAVQGGELIAGDGSRLFVVSSDGSVKWGDRIHGPLRATDAWMPSVALATSAADTRFALVSADGTIGPAIAVRGQSMPVSDMAVSRSGAVVIAAGDTAFLLGPGDTAFSALPPKGVTSVAISDEVLAVRTHDALLFFAR